MKQLAMIETKNYFGNTVYKYGYWKHGIIVQGYDSFGPVAELCKDIKEANNMITEWTYEDSYARLIAKPGKMFIELDKESIFNKRAERQALHATKDEPECKGILYAWDGSIIDWDKGSFEEFDKLEILYGQRLVWVKGKDIYEKYLEYDWKEEVMYTIQKVNHKNIFDVLNEGLEDIPEIDEPKFDFGL